MKLLLEAGVDKDAEDDKGLTPLFMAAHYDHEAVVKLLLAAGADTAAKAGGKTALDLAHGSRAAHRSSRRLRRLLLVLLLLRARTNCVGFGWVFPDHLIT